MYTKLIYTHICIYIYIYSYTLTCKKIQTFCILEDKYNVQLKWFQNRGQLLLDVRGGSYQHINMFTRPMSQIIPKQNCTGGFWSPCTEQVIYECSTEYYMDIGLINLLACSYEPPLTSNNNWHLFWNHFSCTLYLSSKTQNVRIFMQVGVYIYICIYIHWPAKRSKHSVFWKINSMYS